jgi:hypothetical protein
MSPEFASPERRHLDRDNLARTQTAFGLRIRPQRAESDPALVKRNPRVDWNRLVRTE